MDKNAIKKYAVWARRELISRVTQKALQYGITDKEIVPADAASVHGVVLTAQQKKERQALIAKINAEGFEQVMEEVAYTWFNRFSALRFMEVNGYLPTHVRVFTDEENRFKPQILAEAINLEIEGLDMEKVYALKDANDNDALFKYLIITQCNALSSILPGMFQKIDDYTELLFPDNLLREGSAIEQMIALIPEDDWKDAVQIIGWLYQYYNAEKKDDVFAALKKNVKITKENIPATTQLFTPDWIVRYMVENSLGRLWVEGHPNDELKSNWKYYLEEAEQEPDVQVKLAEIRKEYAALKPEDIRCIDPCSGSGHILAYLFDVLVQIYEAYGYTAREAVASIVENNIYGLDIDDRAAQLASFAVMMKARQYDRRFFSRGIQPHVYAIVESNHVDAYTVDYFANGDAKLTKAIKTIIEELHDAKEYGSILTVTQQDWAALYARFDEIREDINISRETALNELMPLTRIAQILANRYDVVITNPPYMGGTGMDDKLITFIKNKYDNSKTDLYSVFIERCIEFSRKDAFTAMITQHGWMFLSSFEKMREDCLNSSVVNMAHLGPRAFDEIGGEVVQSATFVLRKTNCNAYNATYVRLVSYPSENGKAKEFSNTENIYHSNQSNFLRIPGKPYAYWSSEAVIGAFSKAEPLSSIAEPRQGVKTLNNDLFLKLWFEVSPEKVDYNCSSIEESVSTRKKWFPYNKGGSFRKWFGNNDYLVNWENDGRDMKKLAVEKYHSVTRTITNISYFFLPGLTWSSLSSGNISLRAFDKGFIFDSKGSSMFFADRTIEKYVLALVNSKISMKFLEFLAPTLDFNIGPLSKIPVLIDKRSVPAIDDVVENCILLAKNDWDAYENSWDFARHPLVSVIAKNRVLFDDISNIDLGECFVAWEKECEERFNQLKSNEEELNRIFIDIYGLQDELTPEVEDKDVTVRKADLQREVKSLISYAVGCMFGRYSLDEAGLAYAGGDWDESKYKVYPADKDNIIPICDDEYFPDDIVGRFVKFIETVYGQRALKSNLKFIADALGGKGQPEEVIRNYFMNDFYTDHLKIYQKRPIYWLFDSGKKGGFKALIYMHRYQPDTIARIRTDYVHEQQGRYRTAMADLEQRIDSASTSERVKLTKQLKKLQDQCAEIHEYEEKIHHLADQYISIDLDDGVKVNYAKFQDVLAKIK
ncbi:BREX-1 system adenine-specific DNA-methyltransferase PglX [Anaeromicropila populeti]|uniref:site-specific DNA-methyltransferase (adenine-specific) n=1 Tax=Anaeromicropila populeti TaxID=37658 RepID=A0A1I6M0L6_9FIRM|nr:BREX-1 system adenine-specific DNA-methyltransferase PglX [Anaeromicropila populeti]SFS09266.1 Methyltransferase domain-containing protein [Anaeromicropila populeti]